MEEEKPKKSSGRRGDPTQIPDPLFAGNHYIPITMRNAPRGDLPIRPVNWTVDCQSQAAPIWNLRSPNYFPFSVVSSSIQGVIRQGRVLEAVQWCMEMMKTDNNWTDKKQVDPVTGKTVARRVGKGESNCFHRLMIISCEDISLANPMMVIIAAQLLDMEFDTYDIAEITAIDFTSMLARSMKSRVADHACICRIPIPEQYKFNNANTQAEVDHALRLFFDKMVEAIVKGDHVTCIGYVEELIIQSLHDKDSKGISKTGVKLDPLPKDLYNQLSAGVTIRGKALKHYKNKRQLIWVAFFKVLCNHQFAKYNNVRRIVEACYDLAHSDAFRWKVESRLFGRMAILALCLRDIVEERGLGYRFANDEFTYPEGKPFTFEDIEKIRIHHMAPLYNFQIPPAQQIKFRAIPQIVNINNGDNNNMNTGIWYTPSNVCMDKHNLEGKKFGRGMQHFLEIKAFLRHEDPSFAVLSDHYLKLCFMTRFNNGQDVRVAAFDRSQLSCAQYIEWLPQLRQQFDKLNKLEDAMMQKTITITFSECVENHVGNQMIGQKAQEGFTCEELIAIGNNFKGIGIQAEYHDLNQLLIGVDLKGEVAQSAGVLVLRNVANRLISLNANEGEGNAYLTPDRLFEHLLTLDWDKKCWSKGKVVNKHARHNLCFGNASQEPNYEEGKGRIYDWTQVPMLASIKEKLGGCFGPKARNLLAEGNFYYDKTCSILPHGDFERVVVIGLRLGASMNLNFQWYQETNIITPLFTLVLNHSDMYLFSSKAVGTDWKKRKIPTLRHSANYPK